MFNYMGWGGYLLQEMWPSQRIFTDGWTDFYGEDFTREYVRVVGLEPGWRDVLARYDVSWVFDKRDSALVQVLRDSPDWRIVYQDDLAAVVLKAP